MDLESLSLQSFRDQPVAVLGLARSGIALARFLSDQGATVTIYDGRSAGALADAIASLGGRSPRLLLGPDVDPRAALDGQALICTSPSVSSRFTTTEPRLRAALAEVEDEGRVPVVSEVDLFLRLCPAATIGVTGTKGKTTTSSLSAAVLAAGDAPTVLGGNIGIPLIERLPQLTAQHRVVLELSELQLPTLSRGTDVAVYTHVTSDHLDRHGTLESYRLVKRRLAELLPHSGVLVRNDDDPVVREYAAPSDATMVRYRRSSPAPGGVGIDEGWIVAPDLERLTTLGGGRAETGPGGRVLELDDIPIPGEHNVSNVLAATAVGLLHGIDPTDIAAAIAAFPGVEHRLELVAEAHGVRFINDSQGTQPDSVIAAVRSFPRPLVLIAGGRSKGVPIDDLATAVAERVDAAVLIGETADELAEAFGAAGLDRIARAGSMDEAVRIAAGIASEQSPATVLLSPAAASVDMFRDYEARGAAFKSAVAVIVGVPEEG
jgi:UDP-N-acetylmuramoylalanine--D-glutamate ligase